MRRVRFERLFCESRKRAGKSRQDPHKWNILSGHDPAEHRNLRIAAIAAPAWNRSSCEMRSEGGILAWDSAAWRSWVMERSRQAFTIAPMAFRRRARPPTNVLAGIILLIGCRTHTLPNRPLFSESAACCTTFQPAVASNPFPVAPVARAAAMPIDGRGEEPAIDRDYQTVCAAWQELENGNTAALPAYQKSLARMLAEASRCGRLDPRGRLTIETTQGCRAIPISYCGFAWRPDEFCQVLPASNFDRREFEHDYRTRGVGVSLVAVRQCGAEEMFFRERQSFPVTAVLRTSQDRDVLEFYNPLQFDSIPVGPGALRLDRDLTASLVYLKQQTPRRYVEGFLDPGRERREAEARHDGALSARQDPRGVHPRAGFRSDDLGQAVNQLRAQSDVYQHYQFWYFRYPTGGDLIQSAAALRERLLIARETCDPQHGDPVLARMVLDRAQHGRPGGPASGQLFLQHPLALRCASTV